MYVQYIECVATCMQSVYTMHIKRRRQWNNRYNMYIECVRCVHKAYIMRECSVIPPASGERWSRTFVESSSQWPFNSYCQPGWMEGFTPPPSSSPGSKIVVQTSAIATYIRLFRYLGRHHFCITFFHRFWLHFGTPDGSKTEQNSSKNRSKNLIEKLTTFGVDVSSIFNGFGTQLHLKKHQKRREGYQFLCFRYLYFNIDPNMFLTSFLHRFFLLVGSQIPPKTHPKTYQKNIKF